MDLLTKYRGQPMLFIGAAAYRSSVVFGFVRSFDEVISFPGAHVPPDRPGKHLMADLPIGPVTVANLTAAAGVMTTVDGWWPASA
jgi:hypothetical protein